MRGILLLFGVVFLIVSAAKTQIYLPGIIGKGKYPLKVQDGYAIMSINYWRYDTCLYTKKICRYNTATSGRIRLSFQDGIFANDLLMSSQKWFGREYADNKFQYSINLSSGNDSRLIRTLILEKKVEGKFTPYSVIDTFILQPIDTLRLPSSNLTRKVFLDAAEKGSYLNIYVLKSLDKLGDKMLHFWVDKIGIIKLSSEKCWRYSFEMSNSSSKIAVKLFKKIYKLIKNKYEDPYWISLSCPFE